MKSQSIPVTVVICGVAMIGLAISPACKKKKSEDSPPSETPAGPASTAEGDGAVQAGAPADAAPAAPAPPSDAQVSQLGEQVALEALYPEMKDDRRRTTPAAELVVDKVMLRPLPSNPKHYACLVVMCHDPLPREGADSRQQESPGRCRL